MENYLKNKIQPLRGSERKPASKIPYKGTAHTPKSSKGLGDYYGSGIVQKLGTMRDGSMGMEKISQKNLKKPPKSLA